MPLTRFRFVVCLLVVGCDASPSNMDPSTAASGDASPAPDAAVSSDAGAARDSIRAWLEAINAQESEYCRCGFALMEYASAEECSRAHSVGPEAIDCAVEVYAPFEAELGDATRCSADVLARFAACMASAATCDTGALNECERARAEAGASCADASPERIDALFHAIGDCATGPADACPAETIADGALGASVLAGSTFGHGDDELPSCSEGHGAPDLTVGWTAPTSGTFIFDTFGSTFDTTLAVLDGCGGAELACGEDAGERRTSELEVSLEEGQAVIVVIDGFNELATGSFVLNVRER